MFLNFLGYLSDTEITKVIYFLNNQNYLENDFEINKSDYDYYNDIIYYLQPVVYFENIYTTYFDDELLTIINSNRTNYTLTRALTFKDIFEILKLIAVKSNSFNTPDFNLLNTKKSNKLLLHYQKASR